jgi:hypothetical protein
MRALRRLALAALLPGIALLPVAAGAQPGAAPPLAELLGRHVPVLVLHPAERFAPVSVDGFLADADLQRKTGPGWEPAPGPLPAGGADLRLDHRLCSARDGLAASPCYAKAQAARGGAPVVYGAAFRSGKRIALQYWLWYPYNDFSPTVPGGEIWVAHEGDWESVSVLLDLWGKPLLVALSRHSAGARREWGRAPRRGLRPLVFVGVGSHAGFFGPGEHPIDRRAEPLLVPIIEAYGARAVDHAGRGRVVRPQLVRVSASSPRWMAFAGRWGEEGYLRVPGRELIPTGSGPAGPAFHEQWRQPVRTVLRWPRG